MDINYSRQYTTVLKGIILPLGGKNKKNFVLESAQARHLRLKDTEE